MMTKMMMGFICLSPLQRPVNEFNEPVLIPTLWVYACCSRHIKPPRLPSLAPLTLTSWALSFSRAEVFPLSRGESGYHIMHQLSVNACECGIAGKIFQHLTVMLTFPRWKDRNETYELGVRRNQMVD